MCDRGRDVGSRGQEGDMLWLIVIGLVVGLVALFSFKREIKLPPKDPPQP
jgi:hypothetical protein